MLAFIFFVVYKRKRPLGVLLSWLERLPVTQEVAGSSPVTPAIKKAVFETAFLV